MRPLRFVVVSLLLSLAGCVQPAPGTGGPCDLPIQVEWEGPSSGGTEFSVTWIRGEPYALHDLNYTISDQENSTSEIRGRLANTRQHADENGVRYLAIASDANSPQKGDRITLDRPGFNYLELFSAGRWVGGTMACA